jgi:uncharacterized membrane protein (DUF2068 family)
VAVHVKVIGGLFAAIGVMLAVGAFFAQVVLHFLVGMVATSGEENAAVGATVLGFAGTAVTVMMLVFAVPYLITAWGLWQLRAWARIAGIILGVLCLFSLPFGTIVGVYALIVLFQKETEKLFNARPV